MDVVDVLDRLRSGLAKDDLRRLIQVLESALSKSGKTGRPRGVTALVIRAACIAWLRAGRTEIATLHGEYGCVEGPLPEFARDLLRCCRLVPPRDNALYCALRVAMSDCKASLRHLR
jgi:hypothetical protein